VKKKCSDKAGPCKSNSGVSRCKSPHTKSQFSAKAGPKTTGEDPESSPPPTPLADGKKNKKNKKMRTSYTDDDRILPNIAKFAMIRKQQIVFEAIMPFGISCVDGGADIDNINVVVLVVSRPSHALKTQPPPRLTQR